MEPLLIIAAPLVALVALLTIAPNLCRRNSTRRGITLLCALTAFALAAGAGWVPWEALLIAGGLGAVTANQVIKRQTCERGTAPIYQSTTIYEGTFVFVNTSGYATGDTDSGASQFAGIAVDEYDNSSGADGDLDAEWYAEGIFELTGSGFTQADVGKEVFASDNYTITLTDSASAVPIGVVQEYVSATVIRVKITGLPNVPGVTSNVLAFTGSTGANEIRVPDNLADALSIEGTHGDFIVLTTTNGSELITVSEATTFTDHVTFSGAIDVTFSGTTGQSEIVLTDNLADALSIKGSHGDFLQFVTTNAAEELILADQTRLPDSIPLFFGTGSDISILWDGSNLVLATAAADTGALELGADDAGVDVVFYGDTASENMTWDQSADKLILTAAVQINGQGSTIVPLTPAAAQQALSDAGAVNITTYYTAWTTTGAAAGTLADGAQIGQLKKIQLIVDGGDGTLTPSNLSGGTTITFADAGDYAILMWDGSNWVPIELGNDADGATAPVLA